MPENYIELRSRQYDFSRGVVGLLATEEIAKHRFLRDALNVWFRPGRACSVRPGTLDVVNATLSEKPTSTGKYYNAAGNKVFVATDDGAGGGKLWRLGASGYVQQTTPWALTDDPIKFVNMNGIIIAVQKGAAHGPFFFAQTNVAETWLAMALPTPDSTALTLAQATHADGRLSLTTTYYYRVRHRFNNGSSLTSGFKSILLTGTNNQVTVSTIPINPSGRTDYIGWTIERTKKNGASDGPYFEIADGTATSYVDNTSDAGLGGPFDRTEEVNHGTPPSLDGIISHAGRLWGWVGSTVYLSNHVTDDEEATGIANWQADLNFPLDKDDGDTIQTVVPQSDRIVFLKRRSYWPVDGRDLDSFAPRKTAEVGAAGYRAASSDGSVVYFLSGDGIIFRATGDRPEPFGQIEAGHWLAELDLNRVADCFVGNHVGERMVFSACFSPNTLTSHTIEYDLLTKTWTRSNLRITDAVIQKDEPEFNRATMLYVDQTKVVPAAGASAVNNPSFVAWNQGSSDQEAFVRGVSSLGVPQWGAAVQVSNSINLGTQPQYDPAICHDGVGGVIMAWIDRRAGNRFDVYAQRLDALGAIQWAVGGVAVAATGATTVTRDNLFVVPDGSGGAFVGWTDSRLTPNPSTAVYVHRIDSTGVAMAGWAADGTRVSTQTASSETNVRLLADGNGGVFVLWSGNGGFEARFQHLSATSAALAGATGVNLGATSNDDARMVLDGLGGVIVAYSSPGMNTKRLSSTGTTTWGPTSLGSSAYAFDQPWGMCSDGAGGAVVVWGDGTAGAQKLVGNIITVAGAVLGTTPVTIDTGTTGQWFVGDYFGTRYPHLIKCSGDEVVLVYGAGTQTGGTPSNPHSIIAKRLDKSLSTLWTATVRANLGYNLFKISAVTDGADGVIVAWQDARADADYDIYMQRIDAEGAAMWTANGVALVSSGGAETNPVIVFTNAPAGEQPAIRTANYHVWSAYKGFSDYADATGQNGVPIHITAEGHYNDDGYPDQDKDYSRFEVHIDDLTTADIVLTMDFDEAAPTVSLPLSQVLTIDLWDDDATDLWDDAATDLWVGSGRTEAYTGLPGGSIAKRHSKKIDADLTESITVTGWVADALVLPGRPFS